MSGKKVLFGTNTKMQKTASESEAHIRRVAELTSDIRDKIELFIIPSFTSLSRAVSAGTEMHVMIGSQNVGWEERGQFTGEISPLMLREAGVEMIMVGHSERRHIFHETDLEEEKRVKCAVEHGFRTLLCVGETAEQKEYGISTETLRTQIKVGLHSVSADQAKEHVWIAYEPVWAIGVNGHPADAGYANEMHGVIRDTLVGLYGASVGNDIPLLYGGSVNLENAPELIVQPNIDGLFVGRYALDAERFAGLIHTALDALDKKQG